MSRKDDDFEGWEGITGEDIRTGRARAPEAYRRLIHAVERSPIMRLGRIMQGQARRMAAIISNPVAEQMIADAHALERAGIDDPPTVPGVPLAEALHIAARVHLAPTEEWQAFRILRNRLMCNGLTLDEALARIKSMADEEMARHDARPADAAVSELADRYASEHDPYAGRTIVAAVLRRPRDWVADRIRQVRVMRSRISLSRRKE